MTCVPLWTRPCVLFFEVENEEDGARLMAAPVLGKMKTTADYRMYMEAAIRLYMHVATNKYENEKRGNIFSSNAPHHIDSFLLLGCFSSCSFV